MSTTSRVDLHRRAPLHFLVDDLQVWVTYLDANENGPYGVRFKWLEDQYACSPLNHITEDGGYTYYTFESFLMEDGTMDMRPQGLENDPQKLDRLQRIWVAYRQKLGETVFSI